MAMNKAEKQKLEDALTLAALRMTDDVKPDVPPPDGLKKTVGWLAANRYDGVLAEPAWSRSTAHGTGIITGHESGSQGARSLHSKKSDALRSARHKAAMKAASILREIDRQIEDALAEEAINAMP